MEDVNLIYPFRVCKDSSGVYIMDLHATDYYCYHLGYPSMQLKRTLAKRGKGPGEFLSTENIRLTKASELWILDSSNTTLSCFLPGDTSCFQEVLLDKHLVRSLDFDLYMDSLFIIPDYTGVARFSIVYPNGKIKEQRGTIPLEEKDEDISDIAYAQAWRGFLNYNSDNGILAVVTQLGEVIQIYDIPGDSLVNTVYGKDGIPRFVYKNGHAIPTGIMGYSGVQVGQNYIYALFWGYSFDDIKRNIVTTEGGNKLRVFDLKGNPVKEYILDRYISGFYIDEASNVLIGLDVNSDQPVVEWNLSF